MKTYEIFYQNDIDNELVDLKSMRNSTNKQVIAKLYMEVSTETGGYSKAGGMSIVNDCFYCITTKNDDKSAFLGKIKNKHCQYGRECDLGHGNALTSDGNYLYAPTGGKNSTNKFRVLRFSKNLEEVTTFTDNQHITSMGFQALAYRSPNDFVTKIGGDSNGTYSQYTSIYFSENGIVTKPYLTFYIYNHKATDGYNVYQDVYFRNNYFYVIAFQPNSTNNIILAYNLAKTPESTHNNYPCYNADIMYISKKKTTAYNKYEIESLDFDSNGNMFFYVYAEPKDDNKAAYLFKVDSSEIIS